VEPLRARHSIVFVVLLVAVLIAAYVANNRHPRYPAGTVDDDAIAMCDFKELPLDVVAFIDQIRKKQVVGHNVSEFPKLWTHLAIYEPWSSDDHVWYQLDLPMSDEHEDEFEAAKEGGGIPCWPVLGVKVSTAQAVIVKAAVYTQCL
jgi:hypothetical protein